FADPDGLMLEIVGHPGAEARPAWANAPGIPRDYAIHGFHAVTLWLGSSAESERVLTDVLGCRPVRDDGSTRRFTAGDGGPGTLVDVRTVGDFARGAGGAGTVHHVAFRVPNDAEQLALRKRVTEGGLHPTPVIDRNYFHSVYFRAPACWARAGRFWSVARRASSAASRRECSIRRILRRGPRSWRRSSRRPRPRIPSSETGSWRWDSPMARTSPRVSCCGGR